MTIGLALAGLPAVRSETAPAPAPCDAKSWVAGTVELCAGRLVYRDYIYDDYGANTNAPATNIAALARSAGDQRYATDVNSADLVSLELSVRGDVLHARFELNTLLHPDTTVAALAIDTDGGGPLRPWPGVGVSSAGWDQVAVFTHGDPDTNLIEGDLPMPAGSHWRVQAVTAIAGGPVMNVAFRGTDESGPWWENGQAAALETGDISRYGAEVDVADLVGGVTRTAPPTAGYFERVYTSNYPMGEGVTYDGIPGRNVGFGAAAFGQAFHYLGKYQPYGIYVPHGPAPHGLQLALHGRSANHSSLIDRQGMRQHVGEALNRIVLVPLARGPFGYYSDWSERDVLDVMADVEAIYPIDRERVFSGGYSMGGYGTLRFAELYPDRFAGYMNWVGYTGDCLNGTPLAGRCPAGAVGNVVDYVANLLWVPGANLYAAGDELVHVHTGVGLDQALQAAGVPYLFYQHPTAEHLTFAVLDDWKKEAAFTRDLRLRHDPPRVRFRTDPALGNAALDISHDRAYWASTIRTRAPGPGQIDLTTSACGGSLPAFEPTVGAGVDPLPWVSHGAAATGETPVGTEADLRGALANVDSVRIDVDATCLAGQPVTYSLDADGPATVWLSDGRMITLAGAGHHLGTIPA